MDIGDTCGHHKMDKLTLYRGLTFQLEIPVRDKTSALVNLTGYGAELVIKASPDDPDPGLLELAVGTGITVANQTTQRGYLLVEVTASVTDALAVGDCWFDVIVIDLSGRRKHVVENREIKVRNPVNHLGGPPAPSPVATYFDVPAATVDPISFPPLGKVRLYYRTDIEQFCKMNAAGVVRRVSLF